jgi:hypothetical protein
MAARPNPFSSLRVCIQLAKNSVRRISAATESTQLALDTNSRLTAAEQDAYAKALEVAAQMKDCFEQVSEMELPPPPRGRANRKIGRPTNVDVERWKTRKPR